MRIVYLHQYFNTPDMAGGTRSYEMARRLVAAGHEVQMVTTWRDPTDKEDWFITEEAGIRVHWLPVHYSNHMGFGSRLRAFVHFAWAAARRAAALNCDVVFATSTPLTIALPGVYASKRQGVPMVFEIRDLWPDVPIAIGALRNPVSIELARMLERFAYRNSTRIVALAPGMKEAVSARGVDPDIVEVIPNGCDFDVFDAFASNDTGLPSDMCRVPIVYAGTMGIANGVEYISRLAAAVRRQQADSGVCFYLIGDGARRAAAEAEAAALGVLNESVFFMGSLPKRDVGRWVCAAAATIMTYAGPEILYRDSVSNKFFDSLAAGRAVLANFSGYSTITAQEAGAGFILDDEPERGAQQLLEIVNRPGALERAGSAAHELARSRFSRDDLASSLERVLTDAITS